MGPINEVGLLGENHHVLPARGRFLGKAGLHELGVRLIMFWLDRLWRGSGESRRMPSPLATSAGGLDLVAANG